MLETLLFVMKIPNKWDFNKLQQIAFDHSSFNHLIILHIDFKDFMNTYKNELQNHIIISCWCQHCIRYSFTFQKESFRKNKKLIMAIDDKIKD